MKFFGGGRSLTTAPSGKLARNTADLPLIAGHHGHRAGQVAGLHQAARRDLGHLGVVRLELRHRRDVLRRAVGVVGDHHELLLAARRERARRRQDFDLAHLRIIRLAERQALLDPAVDQSIGDGIGLHPLPAAMRDQAGRLQQQQAALGRSGEQTPAAAFLHQVVVILARLEAQERQAKAVLPARLAVTAAAIAGELGEDRDDLIREVDRQVVDQDGSPSA